MEKKTNTYRLKLEYLSDIKGENPEKEPLEFTFHNHDDIFSIVEILTEKALFENPGDTAEFALGLKLFTEVMLRNRKQPLFEELSPAIAAFMKKLKAS
ncbi:DUF3861 domain-containing protein [Flavobacterium sp. UBA4197]|uniref:DUF3861 domain-containing protein n=1 Tax=Flavobacterium sp. UBA4197 TaxID=1946546 RepID=UPI002579F2DE|nr:DUF3861 domain-containing protein [Flavobacterium sp. UBA4197]